MLDTTAAEVGDYIEAVIPLPGGKQVAQFSGILMFIDPRGDKVSAASWGMVAVLGAPQLLTVPLAFVIVRDKGAAIRRVAELSTVERGLAAAQTLMRP